MVAKGFKNGALVCTFEKPVVPIDQNGYDIDTLVVDGVSHDVSPPPAPTENLTDSDKMASLFAQAQAEAPAYLNQLKGAVWVALVEGGMSEAEATAAGVALVLRHAAPLAAFESAGGHPAAAQALYQAISSPESVAALSWLTAPILAIFAAALVPA